MKPLFTSTILLLTVSFAEPQDRLDPDRLIGRWTGTGEFYKANLQQSVGPIPFDISFADDSIVGRVGDATLHDVVVNRRSDLIEIKATLGGRVSSHPLVDKGRLLILVTAINDSTAQAEFHIKSNFFFDPTMREGKVVLARRNDR